jgi:hypothetical protein
MQAAVKVQGYVKLIQLLDSKVLPFILEDGSESYVTIEEDGEVGIRPDSHIAEVYRVGGEG